MKNFKITLLKYILFCSLGVYGDVQRVKILFNKKDNALVQMAEPHHAQLGEYASKIHMCSFKNSD